MAARPHRLAVEIHNAAYRELGLDYTFVYFGISDPAAGIEAIRTLGIRGMNVSMPFKSFQECYNFTCIFSCEWTFKPIGNQAS